MKTYLSMILAILHCCLITGLVQTPVGLQITLAMFSGREDPQWLIPTNSTEYSNIKGSLGLAINKGVTFLSENMPARLGYKGFLVREGTGPEHLIVGPNTIQLQQLLLGTASPRILLEGDRQDISKEIASGAIKADVTGKKRVRRSAPLYGGALWMMERTRKCNNCYNYANDKITDNFAKPGTGSGHPYAQRTGPLVTAAAVHDGLQVYNPPAGQGQVRRAPVGERHLVALAIKPETPQRKGDFHWYRLDRNPGVNPDPDGFWSHKPGSSRVTNKDNSNNVITDPNDADRGEYTEFGPFMTAIRINPNIQGPLQCNY